MERLRCEKYSKEFSRKDNLKRHFKACLEKHGHECIHCGKKFARKDNLKRHLKSCQGEQQHGGWEESPRKKVKLSEPTEKEEEASREPEQEPEASEQEAGPSGYFGEETDVGPSNNEDDQVLL